MSDRGEAISANVYSALALLRHAATGHQRWPQAWRKASPRDSYDTIIIGGGGHGLATAYYLATEFGVRDVAVLERGAIGLGNTGRNTTIVRSNYFLPDNITFYEQSLKMWEKLTPALNFNLMFSQRGMIQLFHSPGQRDDFARRGNLMRLHGADSKLLDRRELARLVPRLNLSPDSRFPVLGGLFQPRAGTARHDAVAWAFARAASSEGVDIIENCEVKGLDRRADRVTAVRTTRGRIRARRVAIVVAGDTSTVASMADLRLPIETHVLQAFVTEPVKPVLDHIVTFGRRHCYVSQTDKGELVIGGDMDGFTTYARRGGLHVIEKTVSPLLEMFPSFADLRVMRTWGGAVDMTMDGAPIIGTTPVRGLFVNGGWCYGGFKATPVSGWTFAHTIATGEPHPLNAPYALSRFETGRLLDEEGSGHFPAAH